MFKTIGPSTATVAALLRIFVNPAVRKIETKDLEKSTLEVITWSPSITLFATQSAAPVSFI